MGVTQWSPHLPPGYKLRATSSRDPLLWGRARGHGHRLTPKDSIAPVSTWVCSANYLIDAAGGALDVVGWFSLVDSFQARSPRCYTAVEPMYLPVVGWGPTVKLREPWGATSL